MLNIGQQDMGILGGLALRQSLRIFRVVKLVKWDRTDDIHAITVPTLVIGAGHDTMDPAYKEWIASVMPHGRYLFCPDGSHLAMYDDQQTYYKGLVRFIQDVDAGKV